MRLDTRIAKEIMERADALAQFSERADMLTRTYLTDAHHGAAKQIDAWMKQAGMTVRRDDAGNVIGRYDGSNPDAPALVTGSHFDTVRNAGRYDGMLGILLPISCIGAWSSQGCRFSFPIEVIAFAEEESVRFKTMLLGSRVIAGTFDTAALDNRDESGMTVREALVQSGFDPDGLATPAYRPGALAAFVEVHIEQGPVLLEEQLALGVVTAIAGSTRFMLEIKGTAGHAGTVPMALRHDAAMAAAEIALYIERLCTEGDGLVGTVGQFSVPNGAGNVIPGCAQLSIDVRSGEDAARLAAVADILRESDSICRRRGVRPTWKRTYESASVQCAPWLRQQLANTLSRCGMPVRQLPSGAGHDGIAMADVTDIAMLFVRCGNGGISHNPAETMTAADAALAAAAFMDFVAHFRVPDGCRSREPQCA